MTNDLLTHFGRWFAANGPWMTERHLGFSLSEPSYTDKPGQYADIDGAGITGRVTLWASGECDTEAVGSASDERLFWEHEQVASSAQLDATLYRFVRSLLNGRSVMVVHEFEEFLSQPAPGFWCSAAGDESQSSFLARVRHETNPPASPEALADVASLPEQVSGQLAGFYKRRNGFTLYQDTLSEAAGIRLFRIEEWGEAAALMRESYEHLGEDEDPDHVVDGLVMGEVPQSGNYFVMPTRGPQIGKVFYIDHDGWYEEPFAQDFNSFLIRVIVEPSSLLSEELGCYTRYSDGKTDTQWIPERYVSDASS